jgi:hypothetical protein
LGYTDTQDVCILDKLGDVKAARDESTATIVFIVGVCYSNPIRDEANERMTSWRCQY